MARERKPRKSRRPTTPEPAPGDLELVQAFVNTTKPEAKRDGFEVPDDLSRWLSSRGLLAPGTELGTADLQRAVAVREGLRALIGATGPHELDADALRRLARATDTARFRLRFEAGEPTGFAPASRNPDDTLGALLAVAVTARLAGTWPLLKVCDRQGCRRIFYDKSRNKTARWCTPHCGERMRARRFRRTDYYKSKPKPKLRFS